MVRDDPTAHHKYSAPGHYVVRLTVTDAAGKQGSVARGVDVEPPPTCFTASALSGIAPLTVAFDASCNGSAPAIESFEWDFGDNTRGSGTLVDHSYSIGGDYIVTLTVRDGKGNERGTSKTITVTCGVTISGPSEAHALGSPVVLTAHAAGFDGSIAYNWEVLLGSAELEIHEADTAAVSSSTQGEVIVRVTVSAGNCNLAFDEQSITFAPPETGPFLRGDCNGDGAVSGVVTDAVFMLNFNFLGGPAPPCVAACDADADGAFSGTVTDAIYVLNFNFLGGSPPAAPYPQCATTSLESDAALGCESPPAACSGP
jgi:PKD repeat protein